jgi:hypothetical protein
VNQKNQSNLNFDELKAERVQELLENYTQNFPNHTLDVVEGFLNSKVRESSVLFTIKKIHNFPCAKRKNHSNIIYFLIKIGT